MGTRGREIVGMDVEHLLKLLNQAYASEWLAYYQYWLGAKLIKGPMKDAVAAELTLHATEELNHAVLVSNRIIQLGGIKVENFGKKLQVGALPATMAVDRRRERAAASPRTLG